MGLGSEAEGLYYLCSENKGADQCDYCAADILCAFVLAYAKSRFSYDLTNIMSLDQFLYPKFGTYSAELAGLCVA